MAFAVLRSTTYTVSNHNIAKAAAIMGKTLSAETVGFLDSISGCSYSDCGPKILAMLETLGSEILA